MGGRGTQSRGDQDGHTSKATPSPRFDVLLVHAPARAASIDLPVRTHACDPGEAAQTLRRCTPSAVLLWDDQGWADVAAAISRDHADVPVLLITDAPTLDLALVAMRAGAVDVVAASTPTDQLSARVLAAAERARSARAREALIAKLKRECSSLDSSRRQVTRQVSSLCNDLVEAYRELADQMSQVAVAGEFAAQVRHELDIEPLLRTSLEFILSKSGPTNGAIFLPASSRDFSLGAYVNCTCPKDTADVLLDHLCGVVAPLMEHEREILWFEDDESIRGFLGDRAKWLEEFNTIVFSCRHDGECLGVVVLFRDRSDPFPPELRPTLRTIADLFGAQLARVVRVHHRHLPREKWGAFGEPDDDEHGMAA